MRPVCVFTDFFVICHGNSTRQTKAIYDEVAGRLKAEEGVLPRSVEGAAEGLWVVVDYLDVVLHVFTPDARKYYALEDLWGDVPSISVTAVSA